MKGNYNLYHGGILLLIQINSGKLKFHILADFDVFWQEKYTFPLCDYLRS